MHADLVIKNARIATLAGPSGPRDGQAASEVGLVRGDVAMEAGKFVSVGGTFDGEAAKTIEAGGRLVTPGYVDSHTHLVYGGNRVHELTMRLNGVSYMEILEQGGGISATTRATRDASVDELVTATRPRLERMLAQGVTSLEAKSGYALHTEGELRMLEAAKRLSDSMGIPMAHTFLGAHAVPSETSTDAYVQHVIDEMLPAVAKQGIATFCDVFVETGVFTPEHGRAIFDAARSHGLRLRLHADEIDNTEGAQLAAEAGCVSADHLLAVSDEGIAAMAEHGTVATLLPTVPLTLMTPRWAPGRKFLDAGVPVALASDHNPNNPVTNMTLVAQLGCYLLGLTPEQALTAVTWNAAHSLGMERSIEVGKRADALLHDVDTLAEWVQEPGRQTVKHVISNGHSAGRNRRETS